MNTQEAYERMRAHFSAPDAILAKEPKPGFMQQNVCFYRLVVNGKTAKCAVGSLIPNSVYFRDMEYNTVGDLKREFPVIDSLFAEVDKEFLEAAQAAHDNADTYDAEHFVKQLDEIAQDYKLKVVSA